VNAWVRAFLLATFVLLFPFALQADTTCADDSHWSQVEKRAWLNLTGEGVFDAAKAAGTDMRQRLLTPEFLRAALTCKPLWEQLGPKGLVLRGAIIRSINLNFIKIPVRFVCTGCLIEKISGRRSDWSRQLKLDDSIIREGVDLSRATFKRDFRGVGLQSKAGINLDLVTVAQDLSLKDARIDGELSLKGASIGGVARFDGAALGELNAGGAKVSNQFILSSVSIARRAVMDRIRIGGDLLLRTYANAPRTPVIGRASGNHNPGEEAIALNLNSARIDGRMEVSSASIHGAVSLDATTVGKDIWIRDNTRISGRIDMTFAQIGQNLDLSTTILGADVDATGAVIKGELRLGAYGSTRLTAPVWDSASRLILRNASASAWLDSYQGTDIDDVACGSVDRQPDPWPCEIDIIDFTYSRIGGLGGGAEFGRSTDWFLDWLSRQRPFSLDPYRRLANHLENDGRDATARSVRFAGKQAQFDNATGMEWLLLFLQKIFVGYGIFTGIVFLWMAGIVALGAIIFSRTSEARKSEIPISIAFSVDMLLPFVQLRSRHSGIDFEGPVRFYLYFHKFMGWVCALFFVSALGGLFEV
jgi:hypothetical protein